MQGPSQLDTMETESNSKPRSVQWSLVIFAMALAFFLVNADYSPGLSKIQGLGAAAFDYSAKMLESLTIRSKPMSAGFEPEPISDCGKPDNAMVISPHCSELSRHEEARVYYLYLDRPGSCR
jgi:hypothetical protein